MSYTLYHTVNNIEFNDGETKKKKALEVSATGTFVQHKWTLLRMHLVINCIYLFIGRWTLVQFGWFQQTEPSGNWQTTQFYWRLPIKNAVQYRESKCYNNPLSSLSRVLGADMGVHENWYGGLIFCLHPFSSFCI